MFTNNKFGKFDAVAEAIKSIAEADYKSKMEELKGGQKKIDKNHNNKIDADDFKILRGEKKGMKKEEVEIEEGTESKADYHDRMHRLAAHYNSMSDEKKASLGKIPGRAEQFMQAVKYAKDNPNMKKEEVDESNNPFDLKNYKSQLPTKPGEKAGFDSKKISTGTVYSRKPVKDEPMKKEEIDPNDTTTDTLKGRDKTSGNKFLSKKVMMDVPGNVKEEELDETKFNPLKHIKNPSPAVKAAAKGVKRSSYADRVALMKAGGVKDDRGPRGVTQEEVEDLDEGEFTIEDVENFMQTEEYEQLDELSKNLVHRYYGKAIRRHRDVMDKDMEKGEQAQKLRSMMAKTNKGDIRGSRVKNPLHGNSAMQAGLKAASDALKKEREPAQKEMAKREKGIDKAYTKIYGGKDRDGNKVVKATGKLTNKKMYGEEVEELDEAVSLSDAKTTAERLVKKSIAAHGISNPTSAKHYAKNASAIEATLNRAKKAFTPGHLANAHSPVSSNQAANRRSNEQNSMSSADKRAHATLQAGVVKHLQKHLDQHNTAFTNAAAKYASKNKTNEEVEQMDERTLTTGETAEKERIVKGMKKSLSGFKARYGDKAKSVMYATATKAAKKD